MTVLWTGSHEVSPALGLRYHIELFCAFLKFQASDQLHATELDSITEHLKPVVLVVENLLSNRTMVVLSAQQGNSFLGEIFLGTEKFSKKKHSSSSC